MEGCNDTQLALLQTLLHSIKNLNDKLDLILHRSPCQQCPRPFVNMLIRNTAPNLPHFYLLSTNVVSMTKRLDELIGQTDHDQSKYVIGFFSENEINLYEILKRRPELKGIVFTGPFGVSNVDEAHLIARLDTLSTAL